MSDASRRKSIQKSLKGYTYPDMDILKDKNHLGNDRQRAYAFNFANYVYDHNELKDFAQELFVDKSLSKIPEWEFMYLGIVSWLLVEGAYVPQETVDFLHNKIDKLIKKYNKPVEVSTAPDVKTRRTGSLIAELEGLLDDAICNKQLEQPKALIEQAGGIVDIEYIKAHFSLQLAWLGDEEADSLVPDKKKLQIVLGAILKSLEDTVPIVNKSGKVRAKKPIDPLKAVSKLKFLKEHNDLTNGLVLSSVRPKTIVGSDIFWVYNVKYRKLGRYIAKQGQSLSVKGSTILNFDEKTSIQKVIRHPEKIIPLLIAAGKVEQKKLMDTERTTASILTGRINGDTILLKVY